MSVQILWVNHYLVSAAQEDTSCHSSDISDIEPLDILPTDGDLNSASAIPNVITVDPVIARDTDISMATSVITGPNSVAMIPTLVNLDFFTKKDLPS